MPYGRPRPEHSATALLGHRRPQHDQQTRRETTGKSWIDSRQVFVLKDGGPDEAVLVS